MTMNLSTKSKVYYKIGGGTASAQYRLTAFDDALLNAGCGNYNLVRVSSILPAHAEKSESIMLPEGSLLPVAYAVIYSEPIKDNESEKEISAAVAIGIPSAPDHVGVIMEYSGACKEDDSREHVISMVRHAMQSRQETDYRIECYSSSCVSKHNEYACAFAYIALFNSF